MSDRYQDQKWHVKAWRQIRWAHYGWPYIAWKFFMWTVTGCQKIAGFNRRESASILYSLCSAEKAIKINHLYDMDDLLSQIKEELP